MRSDLGHAGSGSGGSASISSMVGIGGASVGLLPPMIPAIPSYSPITPIDADALMRGAGFNDGGVSGGATASGETDEHPASGSPLVPSSSAVQPNAPSSSLQVSEGPAIQINHEAEARSPTATSPIEALKDEAVDEDGPATPVMSHARPASLLPQPHAHAGPVSPTSLYSTSSQIPTQGHAQSVTEATIQVERPETPVQSTSALNASTSHADTIASVASTSSLAALSQSTSGVSTVSTSPEPDPKPISQATFGEASEVSSATAANGMQRSASAGGHRRPEHQNLRQKHAADFELDTEAEAGFDTDIENPDGVGETATETEAEGEGDDTEDTTGGLVNGSASDADVLTNGQHQHHRRPPKSKKSKKAKAAAASRKVSITDFEMMRVLGKGCAGKVLLVRHKASTSLYALKAITKRHVLAHQELQHTLTEQAVLKRMARESQDPFVVKLWWSFHDKENLFLVMVRSLYSWLVPVNSV